MSDIFSLKEASVASTPVLCFEFQFWDGHVERYASEAVTVEGAAYQRRVVGQQMHDNSLGSEDAIGYYSRVAVTLANADGFLTQLENTRGFRGALVTVRFVFLHPDSGDAECEPIVVFRGYADAPSVIDEARLTVSAENRFSLFHVKLPGTPIQRRCPWHFPQDAEDRAEAVSGGTQSIYSLYYRCGYSPDMPGGAGNLNGGVAYSHCRGTREDCQQRGMLNTDALGRTTRRFGGFTYLPPSILVRTHGSRALQPAEVYANQARGNDVVPLVYGRGWLTPPVVHSANDGNLTRMLYLVGDGEIDGIERVVVNDIEIPAAVEGKDMTGTGWYKLIATGARTGTFLPKPDNDGFYAESDPHGSMATLQVVIPNVIHKGSGQPRTDALVRGFRLLTVGMEGGEAGRVHTDNPAWVLLDVLLRSGWRREELDLASFAKAAQHCGEPIEVGLWDGTTQMQPRFSCNLVLQKRRSVGEILRGLREGSFLFLRERFDGKLEVVVESTIAQQQPVKSAFSNATEPLQGGWPVYEFGDGTQGRSGILRSANGAPAFRMFSRSTAECANRIYAEFQDVWNEFQNDRISLFDSREIKRSRQEITANSRALGLSTYHQAARSVYAQLKRATAGNRYVEFQTGLRGIGVRPGDLITITYAKYGLERELFRVVRVRPSENYETAWIAAQRHADEWFADTILDDIGGLDRYRNPANSYGRPRPLAGALVQADGTSYFDVTETAAPVSDGSYRVTLQCGFLAPSRHVSGTLVAPVTATSAHVLSGGGTLVPGSTMYYRFSSVGADGAESGVSTPIVVSLPSSGSGYAVQIGMLSAPADAAQLLVYRGPAPDILYRVATLPVTATLFTDEGLPYEEAVPSDANFDHANFYWRGEVHPVTPVSAADSTSVTCTTATWEANQFQGKLVWIVDGKGKAQERTILSNNANTLFVQPWNVVPTVGSSFAIAEPTWQLGTKTTGSPGSFDVPNQAGSVVHVLGVAANALDLESPIDRGVITRWQVGGGSVFPVDTQVPDAPVFTLSRDGAGMLLLSNIGFEDLQHTQTIQTGTLEIYYYDELRDFPTMKLQSAVPVEATTIALNEEPAVTEGEYFQIDREVMKVTAVLPGNQIAVERGAFGSAVASHEAGVLLFVLTHRGMVFPIPLQFFGSPSSGAFRQSFYLPHARVAAAQLVFTNSVGTGAAGTQVFTALSEYGLRSGYGGQYALYVEGYLAIENDAAIPLVVDRDHSVRDVYATLQSPPTAGAVSLDILMDDEVYCSLHFAQGAVFSNTVSGVTLPPLRAGTKLSVNITSVVHYGNTIPGKDLSIRIRL